PRPVKPPPLEFLRRSEVPAVLNENGEVVSGWSNVELLIGEPAPPSRNEIDTSHPVRMRVGYGRSTPVVSHPLTDAFPRVGPLWELVAHWPLDGRFESVNSAPPLQRRQQGDFERFWSGIDSAFEPREQVFAIRSGQPGALTASL